MHPEIITIQTIVKRADSLDVFRQINGKRSYGMLYYIATKENVMVAECISDYTDVKFLEKQINEQIIYIQSHK